MPDTPLYGTVRAEAWHDVHPLIHGDRGSFAGRKACRSCAAPSSTSPSSACPTAATRTGPCGCGTRPGPLSLDELWRAYLARFDIEHAIRALKGILGLTAAKVRAPSSQQRARRNEPVSTQNGRQQPGQRRQDRTVGPVRLGLGDLTPEHRDFMTENHDLGVRGRLAAAQQHQPAKDPDHDQVEEAKGHKLRSCRNQLIGPNRRS